MVNPAKAIQHPARSLKIKSIAQYIAKNIVVNVFQMLSDLL